MNSIIKILLILFIFSDAYGQNKAEVVGDTIIKTMNSEFFKNTRKVKIVLPKNYTSSLKYPVIYALDGYGLFHITSSYAKYLMDYNIIPKSILVGIYHNNRNYETEPNYGQNVTIPKTQFLEGTEKLKNHLIQEIKPIIDKEFSTSTFNVLIGHSNTATFVNELISKNYNPFRGCIALSPDLVDEQVNHFQSFVSKYIQPALYYTQSI